MSRRARWVIAVVALLVAAFVGWSLWFVRNPLAAFAAGKRRALGRAGFAQATLGEDGERLTYFAAGSGQPLLFLHGTGDQAGTWADVAPAFASHFRVIVADLPGHGASAPADGELAMATIVAGSERLLVEVANERPAVVVGNSLGAWLAILLAERHPDRVAHLVLVNGGALLGDPGGPSLQPKDRLEASRLMGMLRDPASPAIPGFVLDDVVRRAASGPIARLSRDAAGLGAHLRTAEALAAITTPVDLLWGASDRVVPLAYAERLRAAFPAVRLTAMERCGHVPQVECPERLREALAAVLTQPPPEVPGISDLEDQPAVEHGDSGSKDERSTGSPPSPPVPPSPTLEVGEGGARGESPEVPGTPGTASAEVPGTAETGR